MYLAVPITLYGGERLVRSFRSRAEAVKILKANSILNFLKQARYHLHKLVKLFYLPNVFRCTYECAFFVTEGICQPWERVSTAHV